MSWQQLSRNNTHKENVAYVAFPKEIFKPTSIGKNGRQQVDRWHGHKRHVFTIDGCEAWVVEPKQALTGDPWTWCMEFPDDFTERTGVPQLLDEGFHHLHIQVGDTFGCPTALGQFDAFYAAIIANGLAKKGTLIGISRGGLYAYNWASQNPASLGSDRATYSSPKVPSSRSITESSTATSNGAR